MAQAKNGVRGRTKGTDALPTKQQQLQLHTAEPAVLLTTNQGLQIPDNHHSLKAGVRGPTLLEDFILREKLVHFDHERIPERVVNARGAGAHGVFQVYKSMASFTCADFLQDPELQTPVFVRFSTVAGSRGSADSVRDVRGFAVKFYTREGNYDLVGNNIPVFYIQDAMKFPDLVHALKAEAPNEIPQASSAHDTFWDFASLMPETTHMLMWAMSDRGIPRSYRMMEGFGVHTFRLINAGGDSHLVKFHWKPKLGVHGLAWDEAQKLAGKDPDFHRRDLWESIAKGHFPEWELGVQVVDEHKADGLGFDLLDATKLIPEEMVPVMPVGRLILNRNPDNFFAETEQVAFNPGHLVPGIDFTNDPLLQGRLFSYTDTQISRLGGANFHELPINKPVCPFHNFQRDGLHRQTIAAGRINYEPSSLGQEAAFRVDGSAQGFQSHPEPMDSPKVRRRSPSFDDHFSQATLFYNSMSPAEKEHIASAFRFELSKVESLAVRQRMVDNLAHVDPKLAKKVSASLGIDAPDPKAAAGQAGFRSHRITLPIEQSSALSMVAKPGKGIPTRRIAVLVADGVDAVTLKPLMQALAAAGGECVVVGPRLGAVSTAGGRRLPVDGMVAAMPSIVFDAVLVAGGKDCVETLSHTGEVLHFVMEAYKHCKPIATLTEGAALLGVLGLTASGASPELPATHPGVVIGHASPESQPAVAEAFIQAIGQHRFWDRTGLDSLPV